MRHISRVLKTCLVLCLVLVAGLFIHTDYYLIRPGSAEDLSQLVTVKDADCGDQGRFYLVTVSQQRANLTQAVYGFMHPHIELERRTNIFPPGMEQDQYQKLLQQWMRESQDTAKIIALRRAGYEVEIRSQGVAIRGIFEDSPATGLLCEGDLILMVDGVSVAVTGEVIAMVQDRHVGDPVNLTVLRGEETLELTISTYALPDNPTLPKLGVYISSSEWEPVIPVDIQIDTGEISGPSAGMMFVLEIMNQLLPDDLTGGFFIAGTGTIDLSEKVERIGGVRQKVIAAEREGAAYFLLPSDNYEEAQKAARNIRLVPVDTLQEALDYLEELCSCE